MTELELLEKVKVMTNYTDDEQNDFLMGWIEEAKQLMRGCGISDEYINGSNSVGIIAKIVTDLCDNGAMTDYTHKRLIQLSLTYKGGE
jgi:hypothetical protein